jgi:hypothetical protein
MYHRPFLDQVQSPARQLLTRIPCFVDSRSAPKSRVSGIEALRHVDMRNPQTGKHPAAEKERTERSVCDTLETSFGEMDDCPFERCVSASGLRIAGFGSRCSPDFFQGRGADSLQPVPGVPSPGGSCPHGVHQL